MTAASAPFSMTRRFPLLARCNFASIDMTTGSRNQAVDSVLPPPAPRRPSCRTRLFTSTGGTASHRSESRNALLRTASRLRAIKIERGKRVRDLDPGRDKNGPEPVEHQRFDIAAGRAFILFLRRRFGQWADTIAVTRICQDVRRKQRKQSDFGTLIVSLFGPKPSSSDEERL